jgi:hypothetical protein
LVMATPNSASVCLRIGSTAGIGGEEQQGPHALTRENYLHTYIYTETREQNWDSRVRGRSGRVPTWAYLASHLRARSSEMA